MFVLCTLEDNVRIAPKDLGKPTEQAVEAALEQTFIDRVIRDVGLVVTLYDLLEVGEGKVYHSDGGAHYRVRLQVVAFRPCPDELLTGTVKDMDESGIRVSLGFFEDVHIDSEMLLQPARWQAADAEWTWLQGEGVPPLYYQRGGEIRFRVHAVRFHAVPTLAAQQAQRDAGVAVEGSERRPHVPMSVEGRADTEGLGMTAWDWGAD